jgi:peptide/nickel transport system substrate-binding protein
MDKMGSSEGMSRRALLKVMITTGGLVVTSSALSTGAGALLPTNGARDRLGEELRAHSTSQIRSLAVGLSTSVSTLNLMHEAGIANYVIALLCQEALVGVSPSGALVPSLASKWTQKNGRVFVYQLRKGVKFSDGTPMTVNDVLASINANAKKGSTSDLAYSYAGIKSIKATGTSEITVELDAPNALFAWTLSPGSLQVTSEAFLTKHGSTLGTPGVGILGTGPYRISEFVPDSHVTVVRNKHWWGGSAHYDEIQLQFISNSTTEQYAMRSKSIQMATSVEVDQVSQWKAISGVKVDLATDNSLVTLAFNTAKAPWNDIHVRKAVAHAIDRPGIVRSILNGHGEVALTMPTKLEWGGLLTTAEVNSLYARIPQYNFDMKEAKSELAASTVPHGFTDTITYLSSGPQIGQALLTLSQNLQQIGINLTVRRSRLMSGSRNSDSTNPAYTWAGTLRSRETHLSTRSNS